jgi:1-phosphofructokinase
MKIIAINLNPCIDWQCVVPKFVHGGLNRVRRTRADVAGKAINVALALKNLGLDAICTGFNFAENGALLTERLGAIRHDFVETSGAIRVNMKLYEESTGVMTELNQPGAFVSESAQNELLRRIEKYRGRENIFVLSGSRPEGVAADFYAKICEICGGRIFLDTEGEALRLALRASPFALKPNLFELESTFDVKLKTPREISDFCRNIIEKFGVKIICVSMGAEGAVLVTPQNAFYCPALKLPAKGVAGAGDAMVAGLVHAVIQNLPEEEFLSAAMAAAAASVVLEGTQMCTLEGFNAMRGFKVTIL